jgi:uncharacterized membrane protein
VSWYRTKVERDLVRWQSAGWVSDAGATAIKADLAARKPAVSAAAVLGVLGAVLFGFAAMSFVAANWSAMSKLARLVLLLAALWACYASAAWLFARQLNAFAHAAVLGGIAVYGASIMLIAQMYHMDGNAPDAVLLWALGALLAAALLPSTVALAAAFVLIAVWTGFERSLTQTAHWAFLAPWAAAAALAAWLRWRPALHLAALSLVLWLVPLGYFILDRDAHWLVATAGAGAALTAVLAAPTVDRWTQAAQAMFAYGLAVAFAGLFIMLFINNKGFDPLAAELIPGRFTILAVLTLALLVAAMYWALRTENWGALWIGYAVALGYFIFGRHQHWLVATAGAGIALTAALASPTVDRRTRAAQATFAYGVAVAFAGLFIIQFIDERFDPPSAKLALGEFTTLAALTLALLVAAMYWALRTGNRGALWVGYVAFAVEIFAIYVRMLGTLLNTSLFFLVAALIVSALAWAAYRLHQRQPGATGVAA